jgi:hypothetical protein
MTNTTHSLRQAGTAIAAALALAATPALAQDPATPFPAAPDPVPQPVIVVPDIPVPVAPEPTVVEPTAPAETAPPESREEAAEPAPPPTASRTRVAATPARAAPDPAPAIDAPGPAVADEAPLLAPVETPATVAVEPAPVAETDTVPATTAENAGILALVLGGLVILALAIWGFIAIGRRKPVRRYAVAKPAPEVGEPMAAKPAPVDVRQPVPARPDRAVVEPLVAPAPSSGLLPHAGASVALPRRLPESFAEREALFRRLVDARPDRANPFTDRKARMKRARLIMQSRGRDFGDARPWIDLSQYPQSWPELARNRSAAA